MRRLNALLKDVDEKTGLDEKTLTNQDNEDVKNQAVLTANLMDDIMSKHILEKSGGFSDTNEKGKGNKETDPVQLTSSELNGRIAKEASLLGPQALSKLDVYGNNANEDLSQKVNKLKQGTNFRLIPSMSNQNELLQTTAGSGLTSSITTMLTTTSKEITSAGPNGKQQSQTVYGESKKKTISPADGVGETSGGESSFIQQTNQDSLSSKFVLNTDEQNKVASFSPLSSLVQNENAQVDTSFSMAAPSVTNSGNEVATTSEATSQVDPQNSLLIQQKRFDTTVNSNDLRTISLSESDNPSQRSAMNVVNNSPLTLPVVDSERILLTPRKASPRLLQNESFSEIHTFNRTKRNNEGVLFTPQHPPPLLPTVINDKNNSKNNNDQWFMVQIPDHKSGRIMISFGNESSNDNTEVSNYNLSQAMWEFSAQPDDKGTGEKFFYITNVTNPKQPMKYIVKESDKEKQEAKNGNVKESVEVKQEKKNDNAEENNSSLDNSNTKLIQNSKLPQQQIILDSKKMDKNTTPKIKMNPVSDTDRAPTDQSNKQPKVPVKTKNVIKNSNVSTNQPGTISFELNNKTVNEKVSNLEQAEKVMHKVISMLSDVVDKEKDKQTAEQIAVKNAEQTAQQTAVKTAEFSNKFLKPAPKKVPILAQAKHIPVHAKHVPLQQHPIPMCDQKRFQNCIVPKELNIDPATFQRKQITKKHKYQFQAHDWKQVIKEMLSGIGKLKRPNTTRYGVTVHGILKQAGTDEPPVSLNLTLSMKNMNDDILKNGGNASVAKNNVDLFKNLGDTRTPEKEILSKNEKVEQDALKEVKMAINKTEKPNTANTANPSTNTDQKKIVNSNNSNDNKPSGDKNINSIMNADQKSLDNNNSDTKPLVDNKNILTVQQSSPNKMLSKKDNETVDNLVQSIISIIRKNSKDEVLNPETEALIMESLKPHALLNNSLKSQNQVNSNMIGGGEKQSADTASDKLQVSNNISASVDTKNQQPTAAMNEQSNQDLDATRANDILYVQKLLHKYAQRYTDDYYMHQYVKNLMKKLIKDKNATEKLKNAGFQQQEMSRDGEREELIKSVFDDDSTKTYIDNIITKITKTIKEQAPKAIKVIEDDESDKSLNFLADCIKSDEEGCQKRHNPLVSPNETSVNFIENSHFTSAEALFDVLKLNGALLNLINLLRTKNVNIGSNDINLLKSILIMMNRFYSKTDGIPMKIDNMDMKDLSGNENMLDILELNGALLNLIHLLEIKDVDLKPSNVDLVKAILHSMNMFYAEIGGDPAVDLPKNGAANDRNKENIALDGQKLHDVILDKLNNRTKPDGVKEIDIPDSAKGKANSTDELTKPKDDGEAAKDKAKEELKKAKEGLKDHFMPSEKEIHDLVIEHLKKMQLKNIDQMNLVENKPLIEDVENALKTKQTAAQNNVEEKPLTSSQHEELKKIMDRHKKNRNKFLDHYLPSDEDLHEMVIDDLMQKTALQNALRNNGTLTSQNNVAYLHNYDAATADNNDGDNEFFTRIEALHKPMSESHHKPMSVSVKPANPIEELHKQIMGMDDIEAVPMGEGVTTDRNPHDVFMHGKVYDDLLREGDVSKLAVNATKRGFRVFEQSPGNRKQPLKVTFRTGEKRTQLRKPFNSKHLHNSMKRRLHQNTNLIQRNMAPIKRMQLEKSSHSNHEKPFKNITETPIKRTHLENSDHKKPFKRGFHARRTLLKRLRNLRRRKNYRGYKRDSIVNNIVSSMNSLYHEVNTVVDEIKKQKDNPNYNVKMLKDPDNKTETITATIYGKPADAAHIKDETTDLMSNEKLFEMNRNNNDRNSKRTLSFISNDKDLSQPSLMVRRKRAFMDGKRILSEPLTKFSYPYQRALPYSSSRIERDFIDKSIAWRKPYLNPIYRQRRTFVSDNNYLPSLKTLRHTRAIVDDDDDDAKLHKIKFIKPKIRIIQSQQLGNYSTNDAERILIPLYTK